MELDPAASRFVSLNNCGTQSSLSDYALCAVASKEMKKLEAFEVQPVELELGTGDSKAPVGVTSRRCLATRRRCLATRSSEIRIGRNSCTSSTQKEGCLARQLSIMRAGWWAYTWAGAVMVNGTMGSNFQRCLRMQRQSCEVTRMAFACMGGSTVSTVAVAQ